MGTWLEEPERVLKLIQDVGVTTLGFWDGCSCSSFSIRNVNVEICCGKGRARGIYIWSKSMDYMEKGAEHNNLTPIAKEIAKQVEKQDHRGPIPIFFHEWSKK